MSTNLFDRLDDVERRLVELQLEVAVIRTEAERSRRAASRVATPAPAPAPAHVRREPLPTTAPAPAPAPTAAAAAPPATAPPPAPGPSAADLLARWDLLGARGLAVAGGVVTLLGIAFFFVLAANRGWIGPGERVLLGAAASAAVFAGGLEARRRLGPLLASLAAIGVGIAGWYTTLAAATILYDLLSKPVALGCAAAIAAVGLAVALAWSSELLAALGLLGAAAAPAAIGLDDGVSPAGTAFAAVVLAALVAVAARRRWPWLLGAGVALVAAQVVWTASAAEDADTWAVAVAGVVGALVAAAAAAWQPSGRDEALDGLALALVGASTTTLLASGWLLFGDHTDRGLALLGAAAVPALAGAAAVRARELAWALGAAALLLGAVATADLASDATLAVVWALQSLAATGLAARARAVRLAVPAAAYGALAVGHALVLDAPLVPEIYPELSAGAVAALAVTLAGAALLALAALPLGELRAGSRRGALAALDEGLDAAVRAWGTARVALGCTGAALVGAAAALGVVDAMPQTGHLVVALAVAPAGAVAAAAGARRGSRLIAGSGLAAVGLLFVKAASWDWSNLSDDRAALDLLVASAAVLAAGFGVRALSPTVRRLGWVYGPAAVLAWLGSAAAADQLLGGTRPYGAAMLAVAAVYGVLAAWALGRERLRNLSTTTWVVGLAALLEAEGELVQGRGVAVAYAATAVGLGVLAAKVAERRLAVASWILLGGTSLVVLAVLTPPDRLFSAGEHPAASLWVLAACVAAAFALVPWAEARERGLLAWLGAGGLVYGASLAVLELAVRVSDASLATDFQRGHTAVSALWGTIGLALLAAGLTRRIGTLRTGGLAALGIALAKLFLYDLSELSSVTRAVSFLAVGAALLAGGLVVQRLSGRGGPPKAPLAA